MKKKSSKTSARSKPTKPKPKGPPLQPQAADGDGKALDLLTMDSTSVTEISLMSNERYSSEIIADAMKSFDLSKLKAYREKDFEAFLKESRHQVLSLYQAMESLKVHTNHFTVLFLVNTGMILNEVEDASSSKTAYMQWLRTNFDDRHLRYFQQAKQLALIADFALKYGPAGKNRLLELDHIRRELERETCEELLADYPLPDLTEDQDGELFKLHIDSVVTHARLLNAGVSHTEFEQSILIASYEKKALTVSLAEEVNEWLVGFRSQRRQGMFDRLVMDKMIFPGSKSPTASKESLNSIVSDVHDYFTKVNLNDEAWLLAQRQVVDSKSLLRVQEWINALVEKLQLTTNTTSSLSKEIKTNNRKRSTK